MGSLGDSRRVPRHHRVPRSTYTCTRKHLLVLPRLQHAKFAGPLPEGLFLKFVEAQRMSITRWVYSGTGATAWSVVETMTPPSSALVIVRADVRVL